MMLTPVQEGLMPFREYQIFYKIVGDLTLRSSHVFPLLTVHGNPVSHESLEPLARLAESGRPVIFYDQLGCGHSDRPDDPSMWTLDLFVDELDAVRHYLNFEQVHILGHSRGGVYLIEYALRQPVGIASLTFHSTPDSWATSEVDAQRLREELPLDVQEILRKHEAEGTTSAPAYQKAERLFSRRHICRVEPWPDYLMRSLEHLPVGEVNVEGWDTRSRLGEIVVPTLVTCGRYDICTPAEATRIANGIPGSELIIFEESSHYAHIEETDRFLSRINDFMARRRTRMSRVLP